MTATHIEFLVEEPSTEAMLRTLLPRVIANASFEIYQFQCKERLLSALPARLRGYAAWMPENYRIVVLLDGDDDDCIQLKSTLEQAALRAGLVTRSRSGGKKYQVVNRIAIEELEAWFFADWGAVCQAYPKVSKSVPEKQGFRDPDSIQGGTWEALERHLQKAGYFKTGLRKIEAARTISEHMQPALSRSRSFRVFCDVLAELIS